MRTFNRCMLQDKHGNSALHLAALGGSLAAVQQLLSTTPGAAMAANKSGQLPVHCAAMQGLPRSLVVSLHRPDNCDQ